MSDQSTLDGNVAAGPLADIFAIDLTAARGQCVGCAQVAPLGQARVPEMAPGVVVRCAGCDGVLLRLVQGGGRTWLDMQGLRYVEIPSP